ncbi:hypothetical protein IKQ19_15220 [Candidatus Saccharibacteria bacterium]|nr:hypothetical protein [Candidatus Saccharibacteria bacterium]
MVDISLEELEAKFFENRPPEEKTSFAELKIQCNGKDYALVCNGHDFVKLLQYLANVPDLINFIPRHYNVDSFKHSILYSDLKCWASHNNIQLLLES